MRVPPVVVDEAKLAIFSPTFFFFLFATTQLNSTQSWVGLIFLRNHTTKTDPHFFSAPTRPNSTKFSMQPYFNSTRRFMQKKWVNWYNLKNIGIV